MSSDTAINVKTFNPFPGLRPFQMEESHLFFGREGQTDEVLMKLSQHRFVGVIGPSGSGKSSFVYCGVLPILYGGFMANAGPNWDVIVARPGHNPIRNLAEAILEHDPEYITADSNDKRVKRTILTTLMKSSSLGLVEAINQVKKVTNKNYLILIDQFEELFRFKDSQSEENALNETLNFINLLMEAINNKDTPIYVTITMRSDFIGECAQFAELTKKINDSHYLIPQLTREQKRRAIEGPVAVGGGEITPTLVQQLLNDLGDNPDQLPILQHALMRTWAFWTNNREGEELIDLKHYEAIGTMAEALSMHANEAYDELTDEQRDICAVLFKTITEKRGENFGIRRPTLLGEIAAIADTSVNEVAAVIEKFRAPGRSLLMPPVGKELLAESMIDISHESLMRIWVRLKNWVDEEAESINMYLRLSEAAFMHQTGKGGLWRPPDLQLALNWQIKHKPTLVWGQRYDPAYERTLEFLEFSRKAFEEEQKIKELQAKKALKRARLFAMIMGGAAIAALIVLLFAYAQKTEAERQKKKADENALVAQKNEEEAKKAQKEAETQEEFARIAKIRADTQAKIADANAKEAQLQKDSANVARGKAEVQRQLAVVAQGKAEVAQGKAEVAEGKAKVEQKRAEDNAALARKERFLSLSRALTLKATGNFPDSQLKGLLAAQGYKFNKVYDGPSFNADVYAGVYAALSDAGFDDISTKSLLGHDQQVMDVTTGTGTGEYVYSGDSRGKIIHWVMKDGIVTADTIRSTQPGSHVINDMVVSPDNNLLLVAGDFRDIETSERFMEVINLATKQVTKISGFNGVVKDIEILDPSSRYFILSEGGRNIQEINISTNTVTDFIKPKVKINDLDISNDGKYIGGAGTDGRIYVWDLTNNNAEIPYPDYPNAGYTAIRFSRDSKYLVLGELDGLISLYNTETQTRDRVFSDNQAQISDIKFSPNGDYLAVSSFNRTIRVWNMRNLKDQPYVLFLNKWAYSLSFSPDSRFLFGGGFDHGEIKVWPMNIDVMANILCGYLTRPLTTLEWEIYVTEITAKDLYDDKPCEIDE
jgi:energy-coupling factor transporter ATP-binding protein EcfA2